MYALGELILYGRTGVCRVEDIKTEKHRGQSEEQQFYILRPLYQACNITTPVLGGKVFSRPIISREQAENAIRIMPQIEAQPYYNRNLNQLREYYRSCMESYECTDLIRLTKSLYAKKSEMEQQKRKFGAVDERFLKEAEDLLFGELAAALEIPIESVRGYIDETLG